MATFQFFNIKVLPHVGGEKSQIGSDGYKKLFRAVKEHISRGDRAKNILGLSYKLKNDFYFSILHIHLDETFSFGKFLKFDKPESLVDTLTGDPMQSVPQNASAHRHEFEYLFVYKCHVMAVQHLNGKSPNPAVTIKALNAILEPTCKAVFPDHYLRIDVLTSDTELRKILDSAAKFKRAEVEISVTNSDEYLDEEANETEAEMKDLGISEISHIESATKNGFMSSFSKKCLAYLKIAQKNGNASIRYVEKSTGKLKRYIMRDHPIKTTVVQTKKMKDDEYRDILSNTVINTDRRTRS